MINRKNYTRYVKLILGLALIIPIALANSPGRASDLVKQIDFENPPLNNLPRQMINPYIDPATGVIFSAEPNYAGNGVVGLVKNSQTSACVDPKNDDQKLGTATVNSNIVGYGTFPIRATFPKTLNPPVTISAEFQTGATTTIKISLFDNNGNLVAQAADSELELNSTCGYPGNPRARETLSVTSSLPVSYAILEVYPPAYVFVIDNFEYTENIHFNNPPVAVPVTFSYGSEGLPITLDGTDSYDPDGDPLSFFWTVPGSCHLSDPYIATPQVTCQDNGQFTGKLYVNDGQATDWDTAQIIVENVPPYVKSISITPLSQVGTNMEVDADFNDPGREDTHTAIWDWGDGTWSEATKITQEPGSGEAFGSHTYHSPGVYTINLTVTDDDGGSGSSESENIVVYDPEGGFVTGGGWIWSYPGAYVLDPDTAGWANFGFVAKYHKGAKVPEGQAELVFHTVGMNFHSTEYEWLVVTGGNTAKFKGKGTINGEGDYKFMIWAGDGDPDTFRIKIWEETNADELVVYDNSLVNPAYENGQPIGKGSIVIHDDKEDVIQAQCLLDTRFQHTDTQVTYRMEVDLEKLEADRLRIYSWERYDDSLKVEVTSLSTGSHWSFTEPTCGGMCAYYLYFYNPSSIGEGKGIYEITISQDKKGEVMLYCAD